MSDLSFDIPTLARAYAAGLTARTLAGIVLDRVAAAADPAIWIGGVDAERLAADAAALDARRQRGEAMPLFGVPFAVKDNIDVAGIDTTAACPAFAYRPVRSATVVERLRAAGALVVGKTNLDQFATGLVGVRSPYGVPRNPFDAACIPGGSSSGSAVAVARGLVSFALGTDTAGSGRVPAMFNNLVGLKPTRGLVSAAGVVPACRSLDCVSIFALTTEDALAVLAAAAGHDADDALSRAAPPGWRAAMTAASPRFRFAVPRADQVQFFGDDAAAAAWAAAVARAISLGGTAVEIDYAPFLDTARLLYDGPWVAERTAAIEPLLRSNPNALLPVTRGIVEGGLARTAVEAFNGVYRLAALRRAAEREIADVDFLLLPTAPTTYTLAEVAADPVRLNANLGTYTNFVNLLDMCAVAVPAGRDPRGRPFGVTLVAPAWREAALSGFAAALHRAAGGTLGATGQPYPSDPAPADEAGYPDVALVVFGAHMAGEPLSAELAALGGRFVAAARTAPSYRMHLLPGAPPRPGVVRVADGGAAIAAELWSIPTAALGALVAATAAPLGIGTVVLDDGRAVKGFLCEAAGTAGARDITGFGGWRAFRASEG